MGVIRKSITFTEQQDAFVKSLIEQGFYTNDSEYIRDIIRKDQERRKRIVDLNEALIEGIESGPTDVTIDSIWEEAINEHNAGK
ncbi:type II toxin-antitoxin system ParD family antitoxin [Flagellimonas halotolerans]|uniref:Type II toxin-antitoxin system ParD family antitoxin n=1 Tax=Flagellimonas halotolerans TaxID=3112164 RepID=A0ABU6IP71_9FLAO|nr:MULTISPECIES: type II toxin-antitoxin system ParD family antitoxin [unclassified Allomuricauda]MEC3965244.1 type II toxin-antitoxin system ParD family antitoxin [Muricauda sp. SYSU M86414]MEC4264911.1 type II toxin-antitoxin system ParD family antitoxin [Muricauda sp. SYSU M84420]